MKGETVKLSQTAVLEALAEDHEQNLRGPGKHKVLKKTKFRARESRKVRVFSQRVGERGVVQENHHA